MSRLLRQWPAGLAALALLGASAALARADAATPADADTLAVAADDSAAVSEASAPAPPAAPARRPALEPLVPALGEHPYRLAPGTRPYLGRLAVSPGWGFLGSDHLFALRVAYNPERWLGYEASLAHNPGHAVHAVLHTLSVLVRRPLDGRLQPYLTGGYGMMVIFPGQAVDAAPVTRNTLAGGGGLELYIRDDLALRAEWRQTAVFGPQRDRGGIAAYDYSQGTIGLAFYRSIHP